MEKSNIFLIGPMGAGKSTVGRQLAKTLGKEFIDSDRVIEERTGINISTIFDIEGEAGFRKREQAVIDELTCLRDVILATGGGAVTTEANRRHIKSRGIAIYLRTSVRQQLARTHYDQSRPLLLAPDPEARLAELMALREPIYRDIADITVDTSRRRATQVAKEIQKALQS